MTWGRKSAPPIGDIIEVAPRNVSGRGNITGTNPTDWGKDFVIIAKKNLNLVLTERSCDLIEDGHGPFRLENTDEPHPAEVIEEDGEILRVKYIPENEVPEDNEPSYELPTPEHEEPIEWEGTQQEIDESETSDRREVFKEEDRRGSKNDLL
jgi:hypothetical protein